jgi:hypothetical protein
MNYVRLMSCNIYSLLKRGAILLKRNEFQAIGHPLKVEGQYNLRFFERLRHVV